MTFAFDEREWLATDYARPAADLQGPPRVYCLAQHGLVVPDNDRENTKLVDVVTGTSRPASAPEVSWSRVVSTGDELLAIDYDKVQTFDPSRRTWSDPQRVGAPVLAASAVGADVVAAVSPDRDDRGGTVLRVLHMRR
jgi:hypothetical protein